MKDRQSRFPGRVKITDESGVTTIATIQRYDDPIEPGTPNNTENMFSDETADLLGITDDTQKTVDGGFKQVQKKLIPATQSEVTTGTDNIKIITPKLLKGEIDRRACTADEIIAGVKNTIYMNPSSYKFAAPCLVPEYTLIGYTSGSLSQPISNSQILKISGFSNYLEVTDVIVLCTLSLQVINASSNTSGYTSVYLGTSVNSPQVSSITFSTTSQTIGTYSRTTKSYLHLKKGSDRFNNDVPATTATFTTIPANSAVTFGGSTQEFRFQFQNNQGGSSISAGGASCHISLYAKNLKGG